MSDPLFDDDEDTENPDILSGGEGGADVVAPGAVAPRVSGGGRDADIISALSQMARTGSQGEARPSYAADAARARSRVASILARSLEGMDGTSGLERLGSAAMATLAGQGRVSLPQAMAQFENQDVGRAVNIANALTGLAKSENAGALTPAQMLNLQARTAESDRREKAAFQTQVEAFIRSTSARYEDPAKAAAVLRKYLLDNDKNITDYNAANRVMAGAAEALSSSGLQPLKVRGKKGDGEGEVPDIGGPGINADGTLDHKPYKKTKGGEWAPWMTTYNQALATNNKDEAAAIFYANARAKSVLSSDERKPFDDFLKTHQATVASGNLIGNILDIAKRNPAALAQVGSVQSLITSAASQVGSLLSSVASDPNLPDAARQRANGALTSLIRNPDDTYKPELDNIVNMWKGSALFKNAQDAAQLRSMFTTLAYSMAAANDPGGRFSNQDIKDAMGQIAATNGDIDQVIAVLTQKNNLLSQKMEVQRRQAPYFNQLQTPWSPNLDVGKIARRVRGEVPIVGLGIGGEAPSTPPLPAYSPGGSTAATPTQQPGSANLPRPATKAEFDSLPSGARFIDPNGKVRTKP